MTVAAIIPLSLCILLETSEQLSYRAGADRTHWAARACVGLGILFHVVRLPMWIAVLRSCPLGIALPLTGLNFVTIALASQRLFGERVERRRWWGIGLVMAGFVLIAVGVS